MGRRGGRWRPASATPMSQPDLVIALDHWAFGADVLGDDRLRARLLARSPAADPESGWGNRLREPALWRNPARLHSLAIEVQERLAKESPGRDCRQRFWCSWRGSWGKGVRGTPSYCCGRRSGGTRRTSGLTCAGRCALGQEPGGGGRLLPSRPGNQADGRLGLPETRQGLVSRWAGGRGDRGTPGRGAGQSVQETGCRMTSTGTNCTMASLTR